jgi:hypothetical protein
MLRDIALEAFEGIGEADALDAVDALADAPVLVHIAKDAPREIVALRALSRVSDARHLGSISRHAGLETVRRGALETLRGRSEASELLAVALNADHRDVALAAVDLIDDRAGLEQVAARGKCKPAVKRARFLLRTMDEQARTETEAANEGVVEPPEPPQDPAPPGLLAVHNDEPAAPPDAPRLQTVQQVLEQEADKRRARLEELAAELQAAAGAENMSDARKRMAIGRREWDQLSEHGEVGAALADRVKASIALGGTHSRGSRSSFSESSRRRKTPICPSSRRNGP